MLGDDRKAVVEHRRDLYHKGCIPKSDAEASFETRTA